MADYEEVYEPSEDTYLVCDAIEQDRKYLHEELKPKLVVEVGCGSGCVITFLAQLLQSCDATKTCQCIATDINPKALDVTTRTAKANDVTVECVQTLDLVTGLEDRLHHKVDVLVFNPPYVPTPDEEVWDPSKHTLFSLGEGEEAEKTRPKLEGTDLDSLITASWAGGENGRIVIDRFLPLLPSLLSPRGLNDDDKNGGRCYLVLVEENKPGEIIQIVESLGLTGRIVLDRRARNEGLQIMLIEWA